VPQTAVRVVELAALNLRYELGGYNREMGIIKRAWLESGRTEEGCAKRLRHCARLQGYQIATLHDANVDLGESLPAFELALTLLEERNFAATISRWQTHGARANFRVCQSCPREATIPASRAAHNQTPSYRERNKAAFLARPPDQKLTYESRALLLIRGNDFAEKRLADPETSAEHKLGLAINRYTEEKQNALPSPATTTLRPTPVRRDYRATYRTWRWQIRARPRLVAHKSQPR